jgi:iron complex outermembrane receptor protein
MNRKFLLIILLVACGATVPTKAGKLRNPFENISLLDSSRVHDLDEVIVISQPKENFRLRQQALSSSMFSYQNINNLGVRDLRELSQYVPSFVMPNYGSRLSSAVYVRGIGSRVNSPAVGIYLDGIPVMSKAAFNLHNYQLERVDILRGPQGTLYGQNTEGGLVRMYSRNPFTYQGTDVDLGYGSRNYRNIEFAHYNKLSDAFAFSLAGFYDGQNGFFRNQTTGDRADKYNEAGGKLRLMYQPTQRLSFDFSTNYQYVRQNAFPYGVLDLATGKAAQPSSTYTGNYRRNTLISGLNIGYKANYFDFNSTTSYQYLKDYLLMDQDYLPADYMHMMQRQFQNALTQEFSLKSNHPVGGFWRWTLGSFFSAQWLKTDGPVFFDKDMTGMMANMIQPLMYNGILSAMVRGMVAKGMPEAMAQQMAAATIAKAGGVAINSIDMGAPGVYRTPQFNLGFYHESNFDLTKNLTFTLGLRYDYIHTKIDYRSSAFMTMNASVMGVTASRTLQTLVENRLHDDFNQLLPKFALTYKFQDGSNVYATVSKGYRAGGYNIQMFSDILSTELMANSSKVMAGDYTVPHTEADYANIAKTISYKPETSWNYEVGTHLNLFENRVHFDFAAYYMQVRNQQLSVMASNFSYGRMMVNAGKSYSCGIEASLRGSAFSNHLDWALSYGLTHAVFKEYTDEKTVNGQTVTVDYKDKKVPYVPMHTVAARADYRIDVNEGALKAIVLGANVNAQGRTYWDEGNTYSQKFYAVVGAHADAELGNVSVSLWARNLTNTDYNTFAVSSSATRTMEYFAQRGNPIQVGVGVKLHF